MAQRQAGLQLTVLGLTCLAMVPSSLAPAGRADEGLSPADLAEGLGEAVGKAACHPGYLPLNAGFFVCCFHVALIDAHLPFFGALSACPARSRPKASR